MAKTKYVKKLKILKNTIKNSRISKGNKSKKKSKTFKNKKIKKTKKTNLLRGGTPNPFAALRNNTDNENENENKNTLPLNKTNSANPNTTHTLHTHASPTPTNSNLTGFIHNLSLTLKEARNSFLQFETQIDRETLYLKLMPDLLSIDKLQYYINNNKISINKQGVNNYLQLNENTFSLEVLKSFYSRTGNQEGSNLIDVYESVDIDKEIYTETRINHIYEENLANLLEQELFLIYVKQTNSNPELEHYSIIQEDIKWLKEITDDLNNTVSVSPASQTKNIELFLNDKKDEIKKIKFNSIDLDVHNLEHLLFEDKDGNGKNMIIDNEEYVIIGYPDQVMKSYLDFLKNELVKEEFNQIYKDHKDNFMTYMAELHNFIYSSSPDKQITTKPMETLKDEIHKFYGYESYYKYISNFYENAFTEENKKTNDSSKSISEEYGIPYDPAFQTKLKELQKAFYNELSNKCLNKPMMQIQYVFLIFKKHTDSGEYVPALFNFRELKYKHHKLLQRMEQLIKTKLPKIYGIIDDSNTDSYKLWYSHYNYGDVFHIKTKYLHTMSNIQQQSYKYKNSITLEELIYMLSIPNVEVINLKLDYQKKNVRFSFIDGMINPQHFRDDKKLKEYYQNINKFFKTKYKITEHEPIKTTKKSQSIKPEYYCKEPENELIEDLSPGSLTNSKVLFMFVETGYIYTFVYKHNNKFYILKIAPNLCALIEEFKKHLKKNSIIITDEYMKDKNKDKIKISMTLDIPNIDLYKIVKHKLLKEDDYKNIMRYNPLLVRTIKKKSNIPENNEPINKTSQINVEFQSPLVEINKLPNNAILIPNSYLKKPLFIRNFLNTELYINQYKEFIKKIKLNNNSSIGISHYYPENFNEIKCNDDTINKTLDKNLEFSLFELNHNKIIINRIIYNHSNCRYNFIEICEPTKSVIWVVHLNSTYSENIKEDNVNKSLFNNDIPIYLGNILYLNKNHIFLLKTLIKLFNNSEQECFLHIGSIRSTQFSLHIQLLKKEYYKNNFSNLEQGTRLNKFISLYTIINLLEFSSIYGLDYYNNYNNEVMIYDH